MTDLIAPEDHAPESRAWRGTNGPAITTEPAGASFLCLLDGAGKSVGHHHTWYRRYVEPRVLAGNLLEVLSDIIGEFQKLPEGYQIPEGVTASVRAAYDAAINWTDFLDTKSGGA